MAYAISGRIVFATNWSSPSNWAYALLLSPSLPFRLGLIFTFGSSGMLTGFAWSRPCLASIPSMFFFCDMFIASLDHVTSMPIILEGSPKLVTFHSDHKPFFISSIACIDPANSNRSLTYSVIIATVFLCFLIYAQGSTCRHVNPFRQIFLSNSIFYSHLDCFSL
jgi:hypothetical protein